MANLPWIWTGLIDNNFGNALNWVTPLAPSSLSDCQIFLTAPANINAGDETINGLSTSANATLSIAAHASFTVIGAPDLILPTGQSDIKGAIVLGAGAHLNLDGPFLTEGTLSTTAGSGVLVDKTFVNKGKISQAGDFTLGDATHTGVATNAAGATWNLNGVANILLGSSASGSALNNYGTLVHGGGKSTIAVSTLNAGEVVVSGSELDFLGGVQNTGTMFALNGTLSLHGVSGTGTLNIMQNGTLTLASGPDAGQTVDFHTLAVGTERLNLGQASTFAGHIGYFGGSDLIDCVHLLANSESFAGGVLSLKEGSTTVAQLHFDGNYRTSSFSLSTDGAGGTLIHFV